MNTYRPIAEIRRDIRSLQALRRIALASDALEREWEAALKITALYTELAEHPES